MAHGVSLASEYVAQLIEENYAMKEREAEYIRHSQTQERCIASLRQKLTEVEDELRRSVCVQH